MADHGEIEARIVKERGDVRVGEDRLEVGRLVRPVRELHDMGISLAVGKLDETEPIAQGVEPHRLGIDGHARAERDAARQIALMKVICQRRLRPLRAHQERADGAQEKTRTSTTKKATRT